MKRNIKISLRLFNNQAKIIGDMASKCGMSFSSFVLARAYNFKPKLLLTQEENELLKKLNGPKKHFVNISNALKLYTKEQINWLNCKHPELMEKVRIIDKMSEKLTDFRNNIKSTNLVPRNCRTPGFIKKWILKNLHTIDGVEENDDYLYQVYYLIKKEYKTTDCVQATTHVLNAILNEVKKNDETDKAKSFYEKLHNYFQKYTLASDFVVKMNQSLSDLANHKNPTSPGRIVRKNICVSPIQLEFLRCFAFKQGKNISSYLIFQAMDYEPEPRITSEDRIILQDISVPKNLETELKKYSSQLEGKSIENRIKILNNLDFLQGWIAAVHKLCAYLNSKTSINLQK